MTPLIIAMVLVLVVAAIIFGIVVIGIEGRGKRRAPQLADRLGRAAQHLNGDAEPPKSFTRALGL